MPAIIEVTNPFGNLVASVDDDGNTLYLYVHHAQFREWGFRPLWLANKPVDAGVAPGQAPRLPVDCTDHPAGHEGLHAKDLEVVWTPAGDGVFLFHQGQLLAHLPGVDDTLGSPGFSRHSTVKERFAWPLRYGPEDLAIRGASARVFWAEVRSPEAWERTRDAVLGAGKTAFGPHEAYWAIEESRWPSLGVARYAYGENAVFTTVGMSLPRMPAPTDFGCDRAEIAFAVSGFGRPEDGGWCVQTAGWLGRYPWSFYTPLEDGALIMAPTAHARWFAPDSSAVMLLDDPGAWFESASPRIVAPAGVRLLWAIFLSADEVKLIELRGRELLRQRHRESGRNVVFAC